MANRLRSSAACVALVAIIVPLVCVEWIEAQKTIKNSFQQSYSTGSAPQSVYGGYNSEQSSIDRQRTTNFVAPVQQQQRRTQQTFVSRQSARQPVYQQQQQQQESYSSSSSSNYDQQAEADAEPPSYG